MGNGFRHCIGATLTIMLAVVSILFQIFVAFLDESMVNRSFDVYGATFPVDLIFPTVTVSLNFFIVVLLYKFAKWEQHHSNGTNHRGQRGKWDYAQRLRFSGHGCRRFTVNTTH